jgi:predicted aspartyl protease
MMKRRQREASLPEPVMGRPIAMGVTTLFLEVANPATPEIVESLQFTVDSGAVYSVVPADALQRLGIRKLKQETFRLADGSHILRWKGGGLFKLREYIGVSDVIFGEEGDATLLGALTLEALGLCLDPIKRELRPMQLIL